MQPDPSAALALTILLSSCVSGAPGRTAASDLPSGLLDRHEALVYRVADGQTLSEIALLCDIPGGATTLADWNGLEDPDVLGREQPLLLPAGVACSVPLEPAAWPRFTSALEPCALEWQHLDTDSNDSKYRSYTPEGLDALSEEELTLWFAGKRDCAELESGLELCFKPWGSPGLRLSWQGADLLREEEPVGAGGSGGRAPIYSRMDLDGDGDDEWVIAQLRGWSNGISLSSWNITVLEEAGAPPAQVRASHFQPGHFLYSEVGGCDLLQTHRLRLDDPYWGEGYYFSGRRLAWSGEDFAVVGEDFAARRLTERFLRSRDRADVLGWFASDDAEARPAGQW